jgi:aspartyl aminopeptidase
MHSPLEIASKYDIYTSYKAYKYFFESFWLFVIIIFNWLSLQ